MDATKLSSNWNNLKATIKAQAPYQKQDSKYATGSNSTGLSLKRKAPDAQTSIVSKRRKDEREAQTAQKKRIKHKKPGMGAALSTGAAVTTQDGKPSTSTVTTKKEPPLSHRHPKPTASTYNDSNLAKTPPNPTALAGKYIALDCEMVGTHSLTPLSIPAHNQSGGPTEFSILARVSIVNYAMEPLYDAYVLPPSGVIISDYRTRWSGITAWHLNPKNSATDPKPFATAQAEVAALLKDRVLVGHALKNDLDVLGLSHPRRDIRDTSRHARFRALSATTPGGKGRTPGLRKLAEEVLGLKIQGDEAKGHSSVEDARATMGLFRKEKAEFEKEHRKVWGADGRRGKNGGGKVGRGGHGEREASVLKESSEDDAPPARIVKGLDDEDDEDDEDDDLDDLDDEDEALDSDIEAGPVGAKSDPQTKQKKKKKKKKKSRTKRA